MCVCVYSAGGVVCSQVKISSAQMIDAATLLVEEVYHQQSAVDCQQVMVRQSLVGELMRTIKHVLPGIGGIVVCVCVCVCVCVYC